MHSSRKYQILSNPGLGASLLSLSLLLDFPIHAQPTPEDWFESGRQAIQENLSLRHQTATSRARNIILFVGDGMGISTVTAARILEGQLRGESGEENELFFETFPNVALSKTYSTNFQVADSAGTMTAMATGVKTLSGVISVNDRVVRGDCGSQHGNELMTFLERAEMGGLSTGVVSTARLTHATPAANYAHSVDRNFESDADAVGMADAGNCADIARQLVEFGASGTAGNGLEVALGGGRSNFLATTQADPEYSVSGARLDGRDLPREWLQSHSNSAYVWNKSQFDRIEPARTEHLLGLFEPSHMQYEADRDDDSPSEPSLSEMTAKAIEILSKNASGFYLNVEAGRIDHAHHGINPQRALLDTIALSDAVRTAVAMVDLSETLIVVTADHSHVFTIAGYPERGNPILGKTAVDGQALLAADGLPYTTLGYINGPERGFSGTGERRRDLSATDTTSVDFQADVLVPLASETHGGEDVAIYAIGAGSDLIRGVMEQHEIFHVLMQASELDQP